ncbi:hypothetical protein PUN28_004553 [Cardiocondyla obscurior]|uniref:Uncharacterized protein n=1 Tax=Cardiocondyla obscurior TaxID=286306 RepID=A0AAW2GGE8_9HYME
MYRDMIASKCIISLYSRSSVEFAYAMPCASQCKKKKKKKRKNSMRARSRASTHSRCNVPRFRLRFLQLLNYPTANETFLSLSPRLQNHPSRFPCIGFGFPSESTRTGTFFIRAHKPIRGRVRAGCDTSSRVCTQRARLYRPVAKESISKLRKSVSEWRCDKNTRSSSERARLFTRIPSILEQAAFNLTSTINRMAK